MFKKLDLQKTLTQVVFENMEFPFWSWPGFSHLYMHKHRDHQWSSHGEMGITHIFSEIMICGIFVGNRCISVTSNQVTTLIFIQIMPTRTNMFFTIPK